LSAQPKRSVAALKSKPERSPNVLSVAPILRRVPSSEFFFPPELLNFCILLGQVLSFVVKLYHSRERSGCAGAWLSKPLLQTAIALLSTGEAAKEGAIPPLKSSQVERSPRRKI
jgi:hypothetical protein